MKSRRGFTLIEMGTVLTILVLSAALVVPNIARWVEGDAARRFPGDLRRLFDGARERAIESQSAVTVRFDDADRAFVVSSTEEETGGEVVGPSVRLLENLEVGRLRLDGMDLSTSEWEITYFADGTHESAAVELNAPDGSMILRITPNRGARLTADSIDEDDTPSWEAGTLEERA